VAADETIATLRHTVNVLDHTLSVLEGPDCLGPGHLTDLVTLAKRTGRLVNDLIRSLRDEYGNDYILTIDDV
jgi:hypothetical protein